MSGSAKTYMIIAGETSGDKHAAHLVESMKKREDVRMIGIGGDRMKAAGVEVLHHVKELSVMGFSEVISKLPFFRKVRRDLLRAIANEKPSTVILVDYPGFNLRFAELAKKNGMRVIYFISPQVWAWGKRRIKKIRATVDLMLTIFKFEEEMYRTENVNARFVGHPLLDEIKLPDQAAILNFREELSRHSQPLSLSTSPDGGIRTKVLALLPGSRLQEINRILPVMLETVRTLKRELIHDNTGIEVVIGCAPGVKEEIYNKILNEAGISDLTHSG